MTTNRRPGHPIGPHGKTRRVEATIPVGVVKRIDAAADREGRSRSAILTEAALQWLARSDSVRSDKLVNILTD